MDEMKIMTYKIQRYEMEIRTLGVMKNPGDKYVHYQKVKVMKVSDVDKHYILRSKAEAETVKIAIEEAYKINEFWRERIRKAIDKLCKYSSLSSDWCTHPYSHHAHLLK